jgi:hypothetical protein
LHPRPRRRTLTYHDVHPGDRGWVGLRFKDLVRVQSFFGVPPRNVTAESKHHDVVAVAADGAEAAFSGTCRPGNRPVGRVSRYCRAAKTHVAPRTTGYRRGGDNGRLKVSRETDASSARPGRARSILFPDRRKKVDITNKLDLCPRRSIRFTRCIPFLLTGLNM